MAGIGAAGAPSPDLVIPVDDTGSETSSRYRYQDQLAAAHCLSMLANGGVAVICEWHADFVLEHGRDVWELVSVKHRDEGSWSFAKLFDDGGLALLFDTWVSHGQRPRVRLCTNAGFSNAKSPIAARLLEQLCGDQLALVELTDDMCTAVAWAILKIAKKKELDNLPVVATIPAVENWTSSAGLPDGMGEAVRAFLQVLRIEKFPAKEHVRDHIIRTYVEPALDKLGRDTRAADTCYDRLLEKVYAASRDNDGRPLEPLGRLNALDALSPENKRDERVRRRTLTAEHILECLNRSHVGHVPLLPAGRRPPSAPGGTKLVAKLRAGRVSEEDQKQARELRDLWHDSWPRVATGFPQDLEVEYALEQEILNLVRALRLELTGVDKFGTRLMVKLHEHLRVDSLRQRVALPLHDHHLLGFAYELSDQCRFAFTDEEVPP